MNSKFWQRYVFSSVGESQVVIRFGALAVLKLSLSSIGINRTFSGCKTNKI
jgi:hypothetical protein